MSYVYLSGPMTGIPNYNREAFNDAARRWQGAGFRVNNPAQLEHGYDRTYYMREAVRSVLAADALVVSAARSCVSIELVWLDSNPGVCVLVSTAACALVSALTCAPCSALICVLLKLVISLVAIAPNAAVVSALSAVVLSLAKSAPVITPACAVVRPTVCVLVNAAACAVVSAFT